jgi:hypothetical protein
MYFKKEISSIDEQHRHFEHPMGKPTPYDDLFLLTKSTASLDFCFANSSANFIYLSFSSNEILVSMGKDNWGNSTILTKKDTSLPSA